MNALLYLLLAVPVIAWELLAAFDKRGKLQHPTISAIVQKRWYLRGGAGIVLAVLFLHLTLHLF